MGRQSILEDNVFNQKFKRFCDDHSVYNSNQKNFQKSNRGVMHVSVLSDMSKGVCSYMSVSPTAVRVYLYLV